MDSSTLGFQVAIQVLLFLVDDHKADPRKKGDLGGGGLNPRRWSAAGYAEFHPRAGNGSADDRARNRRVDLVILNDATLIAEEPAAAFQAP